MTDELRTAAERIRQASRDSDAFDGGHPSTALSRLQTICDHALLASAWLAEHPADDGDVVTDEFVREVCGGNLYAEFPAFHGVFPLTVRFQEMPYGWVAVTFGVAVKTKGDVRRLLRALGVPLKVGA